MSFNCHQAVTPILSMKQVSQAALLRIFKSNHVYSSWLAKKHANLSYKATKHSERTFLISNYY